MQNESVIVITMQHSLRRQCGSEPTAKLPVIGLTPSRELTGSALTKNCLVDRKL